MARSDQLTAEVRRNSLRFLLQLDDIFDTSTGHSHDGSDSASLSATGNTLDGAYNQGGAGSGRAIGVTDGAITMTKDDAGTENVLELDASPSAGAAGSPLSITCGASCQSAGIAFANSGSGDDVQGTSSTWLMSAAGLGSLTNLALLEGTKPANSVVYAARDNTGDLNLNALSGKNVEIEVAGTSVITVAGAAITLAQATTISAGGLTVSAGGAAITGNSTVTGDLTVTGSFTFGGALTVNDTLTVDELILDTDGAAPGATNCSIFRDNAGDLTLNAVTGKVINLAIAETDEYRFSATAIDMLANALDNCGFLVLNAATAPAGTEVYLVNDNTGDLTLNAVSGKTVLVAIAGTDEFTFSAAAFIVAAANDIQFAGNDGILDSSGNEVILVEAVGSAVNYLNVKNAATGDPITLECLGTADRGFVFQNDQDEPMLVLVANATGDTYLEVHNTNAGQPILKVVGTADTGLEIQNAAGEIMLETLSTGAPLNWLSVSSTNTGNPVIFLNPGEDDIGFVFQAKNAEEILILATTAAAINEITITAKDSGNGPEIAASGGEADIDLVLVTKGTGLVQIPTNGLDMATKPIYGGTGANENLLLHSTESATKGYIGIPTGHEGLKIGGTADRAGAVGDNVCHIFDGAAAPAGALANGVSFYSEAGEAKVLDAAGNSTTLSPHTPDGDYIIHSYSVEKDETVTIHIEKLMRAIAATDPSLARFIKVGSGLVRKAEALV